MVSVGSKPDSFFFCFLPGFVRSAWRTRWGDLVLTVVFVNHVLKFVAEGKNLPVPFFFGGGKAQVYRLFLFLKRGPKWSRLQPPTE